MAHFFFSKGDQQFGPVTAQQLKQHAAEGKLLPTDFVWREGTTNRVIAGQVGGLLFKASVSVPVPSSLQPDARKAAPPRKVDAGRNQQPPTPPPSPIPNQPPQVSSSDSLDPVADLKTCPAHISPHDSNAVSGKLDSAVSSFVGHAKAAGQLIAKQAERTKLQTISLPNAFNALGKNIFSAGKFREELKVAYATLDANLNAIKQLKAQAAAQPKAENLTDKAKAAARATTDMAQVKVLQTKASHALTDLGRTAFERFRERAGPPELIQPIMAGCTRREVLDEAIAKLSQSKPGQIVTPKRLAFGVCAAAVLFVATFTYRALFVGGRAETRIDDAPVELVDRSSRSVIVDRSSDSQPTSALGNTSRKSRLRPSFDRGDLPPEIVNQKTWPDLPLAKLGIRSVLDPNDPADVARTTSRTYFSPKGGFLAIESAERQNKSANDLRLWKMASGEEETAKSPDCNYFSFPAAFSPDETHVTCIDGELLRVWDLRKTPASLVQSIHLELAPVSKEGWNKVTWNTSDALVIGTRSMYSTARLYQVFRRTTATAFSTSSPTRGMKDTLVEIDGRRYHLHDAVVTPDGKSYLVLADTDEPTIFVRAFATDRVTATLKFPNLKFTGGQAELGSSVLFSSNGEFMAFSLLAKDQWEAERRTHTVKLYKTDSWREIATLPGNAFGGSAGTITAFALGGFSPNGKLLAGVAARTTRTGRGDKEQKSLLIWDTMSGKQLQEIVLTNILAAGKSELSLDEMERRTLRPTALDLLSFDLSGSSVTVGSTSQAWNQAGNFSETNWTLRSWNVTTGKRQVDLAAHMSSKILHSLVALSPDCNTLIARGDIGNSQLVVWDVSHLSKLNGNIAEGDSLWRDGRISEAAKRYFAVLGDKLAWVFADHIPRLWSRSVDAYVDMRRPDDARKIVSYALTNKIALSPETPKGRQLLSDYITALNEAREREAQEEQAAEASQLARTRAANKRKAIVAAKVTKKQFIATMHAAMARGRIDDLVTYAIFEDYAFQDIFGEPDRNVEWVNSERLFGYRCANGSLQLTVTVIEATVIVSGMSQF
jgi:hypothetical protein